MQVDKSKQDKSCWRTLGTAKMRTAHLTFEQHRRRKSWDTSSKCERGKYSGTEPKPHPERFSQGGEAASSKVTHMYYTHTHTQYFISYLLIFVPPQDFQMTKRRGWKFFTHLLCPWMHHRLFCPHLLSVHLFQDGIHYYTTGLLMFLQQMSASRN